MYKKSVYCRKFKRTFKNGRIRYAGHAYRPLKGLDYSGLEGKKITVEVLSCTPDFVGFSELFYVPTKAENEVMERKDSWHSILLVPEELTIDW